MVPERTRHPEQATVHTAGQGRKLYLDVLRILATFLVCYNHSFAFELYLGQVPDGSLISWLNVGNSALATVCLPLFFMISGALLLGKCESYRDILSKRIWRFLVLLVCASGVTYLFLGEKPLSAAAFVRKLLRGDIHLTYWYLYAYLSLLLAKPFLQKIAAGLTGKDIVFLLALRVIFFSGKMMLNGYTSVADIGHVSLSRDLQLPFVTFDAFFYPLAGYYLSEKLSLEKLKGRHIFGCLAVIVLGTAVTSLLVYSEGYYLGFTQNYTTLFTYASAMAIFVLVRYGMGRVTVPHWLRRRIIGISNVAIGIYLLEPIVDHYLFDWFHEGMPWTQTTVTARSLLWCLLCMILCGGMTCLLRCIPGVKKYL